MKKLLLQNHRYIKKTGLLFIAIFLLLCNAFAGDISISLKYRIEIAMEDVEQPIVTEVSNSENIQVLGAALNLTIRDKLTLNVAYQWSTDIGTVEPLSSVTLKAPDPWIPKAGMYNIRYELSSDNDINPANDTLSYDIEVKPNLGLSFKLNQFNFISPIQQENSNTGRVDVKLPPNETNLYLNMTFAEPGNLSLAPQWLVQNFPLPAFQDTQKVSYWIDLDKIGIMNGMQIPFLKFDYTVSDTPIKEPVLSTKMYLSEVFESDYNVGGDNSVDWDPGPFQDIIPIDWNDSFKVITWNYRGCKIPDIDLDSSKYNPRDMAGEVGDWNACGPAAAVNSLQWLEDSMQNIPKTNTTLREKISIYNKLSNRHNESGMTAGDLIGGKLAYIDSFKLPIRVKWQGFPYFDSVPSPNAKYNHLARTQNDSMWANAQWDWLVKEMAHGEDVEIMFGWYDTLNVRHGGHWVTVSGVSDVNIAKGIYVKDDEDQSKEGGTRQTYLNWVTNENGRPRLVGFKGANNTCWVESVVSESYDSTVTFVSTHSQEIRKPNQLNLTVYENPSSQFEPVNIGFDLAKPGDVQISIYEISGRLVFSREIRYSSSGTKTINWNGNENSGTHAGSGIYLVKVVNGGISATAKFIRQN